MSISMLGDYKNFDFSLAPQSNPSISNQQRFEQNYGAPVANLGGIPLSVSAIGENGKRFPICQTLSIGRDRIPPSYFSVPANYKRADSEVAVMMDKKGLDTMKEIMADLGDEDPKEIENLLEDKKGDADQSNGSVGSISQK